MKSEHRVVEGHDLLVLSASGFLDLENSKAAMTKLGTSPEFESHYEILIDFSDIDCDMSVTDVYELASHMAWPNPALPTHKKIAVVVSGRQAFDFAQFLEICAINRGLRMRAFTDAADAVAWLDAEISEFAEDESLPR